MNYIRMRVNYYSIVLVTLLSCASIYLYNEHIHDGAPIITAMATMLVCGMVFIVTIIHNLCKNNSFDNEYDDQIVGVYVGLIIFLIPLYSLINTSFNTFLIKVVLSILVLMVQVFCSLILVKYCSTKHIVDCQVELTHFYV